MLRITNAVRLAVSVVALLPISAAVAVEPVVQQQTTQSEVPEVLLRRYLEALDRMDREGAEQIAKRAAEQSHGPIVELMMRHTRLLAANESEKLRKGKSRYVSGVDRKNSYYTATYNVADLVVPLPTPTYNPPDPKTRDKATGAEADFAVLIDLIRSTIKPTTWESSGGRGTIVPFETNLSIVVSQTQEVHEEIVALLRRLRRQRDVTLMFDTRLVTLPEGTLPKGISDGSNPGAGIIEADQVARLLKAAEKNGDVVALRRVTLFNNQRVALPVSIAQSDLRGFGLQARIASDRRFIQLELNADKGQLASVKVADGASLAFDLTSTAGHSQESDRHPTNTPPAAHRLLLFTPHIIIAQEEEEKLGVQPAEAKK
jgi:hypothetical protein